MMIEKLDGPKGDAIVDAQGNVTGHYEGVVIGTEADLVDGDWARFTDQTGVSENRWYAPVTPTPVPRILTKTAFQDYAVSQLGGGMTGMGRFTEIMDATRDSTSPAVRFAFARYEAAATFEKQNTAALTAVMAADTVTNGHLTDQERTDILTGWPEA